MIESGATDAILNQPKDAYTQYLISAKKKINEHFERVMRVKYMLKVTNVEKSYGKKSLFRSDSQLIIKGISFECSVGEYWYYWRSGSGKSTLSRMILGIEKPDKD